MYAFRKYRAAFYHSENVGRFLADESSDLNSRKLLDSDTFTNNARAKISVRKTADHFIYETKWQMDSKTGESRGT